MIEGFCNNKINPVCVDVWQSAHSSLKNLFAEERLDDVGAIKTVHAVHPKHSILSAQWSPVQLCVQPAEEETDHPHNSPTGYIISVSTKVDTSLITLFIATLRTYMYMYRCSSLHSSYGDVARSSK